MTALYIFIVLVASQRVPFRGFGGHTHMVYHEHDYTFEGLNISQLTFLLFDWYENNIQAVLPPTSVHPCTDGPIWTPISPLLRYDVLSVKGWALGDIFQHLQGPYFSSTVPVGE